jgi:hypothetical protein
VTEQLVRFPLLPQERESEILGGPGLPPSVHLDGGREGTGGGNNGVAAGGGRASDVSGLEAKQLMCC